MNNSTDNMSLNDKVIMITGGGQGIGRALAQRVLNMGGKAKNGDPNPACLG